MTRLAWASLRARSSSFTATFLSIMLASALIGSFATLAQAGLADGVSDSDSNTLLVMGAVVGSWGSVIALFSLTSTLGIMVRQRDAEVALLRTIGATPRQARRMIRIETFLIAVLAGGVGALLALAGGSGLLALLRGTDVVDDSVGSAGAGAAVTCTVAVLVVVSVLAATIAGRRATRGTSLGVLAESRKGNRRLPRWRVVVGVLLVAYGTGLGAFTLVALRHADDPYAAMQTCGSASIVVAVGLATVAPALLRWAAIVLRPLMGMFGAPGHLAGHNASRRAHVLAGVLGPVLVLTATAVTTLMAVGIDDRTLSALTTDRQEQKAVTLLNYVVTGMIGVFAAIMVLNALVAVIGQRKQEFRRLHLVGATPQQVRSSVLVESAVIAAVGIVLGLLASVVTVLPYSVVRGEGVVPDGQLWVPAAIAVLAAVLTLGGSALAVRRTMATARRLSLAGTEAVL
jgi:putative ABC transport system permease protein